MRKHYRPSLTLCPAARGTGFLPALKDGASSGGLGDDNAEDLDRARAAVRKWRAEHPQGTAGKIVAELGGQFHPDYEPVLRGVLAALELHGDRNITGGPHD